MSPESAAIQHAISTTVVGMLHAIDARDWNAVRAAFADTVTTDYTSLFGGEAETQLADDLVGGWASFVPGFDATQHLAGPIVAEHDGATARARCAITATHCLGEARWIVGGHYALQLTASATGWKITHMTLETAFQDGDLSLPQQAAENAR